MAFSIFSKSKPDVNWKNLTSVDQLEEIEKASFSKPQIIFKHSTRCSISNMARNRVQEGLPALEAVSDVWYLDLLSYRNVSDTVADKWGIMHESPQVIIIKNGEAVYDASHNMIVVKEMENLLKSF